MLAETSTYRRKKQMGFSSRFVTMCLGQLPVKSKDEDGHLSGLVVAGCSRGWAQQQRMLHGGAWPQHGLPGRRLSLGEAPDGQPRPWGRSGVAGGPEQGQSHSFARGRKAFPPSPHIDPPLCVSLVCNFKW